MAQRLEAAINCVVQPIPGAQPSPDGVPYPTHAGELELVPGLRLRCFRLNTGQAVVDEDSMKRFLDFMGLSAGQAA